MTSQFQPTVSGDAELAVLPFAGCRELLGRQKLGQIGRLVERPDFDLRGGVPVINAQHQDA
jgi:hypothetical protein